MLENIKLNTVSLFHPT